MVSRIYERENNSNVSKASQRSRAIHACSGWKRETFHVESFASMLFRKVFNALLLIFSSSLVGKTFPIFVILTFILTNISWNSISQTLSLSAPELHMIYSPLLICVLYALLFIPLSPPSTASTWPPSHRGSKRMLQNLHRFFLVLSPPTLTHSR